MTSIETRAQAPHDDPHRLSGATAAGSFRRRLLATLVERPYAFSFFQAVRSLMRIARQAPEESVDAFRPIGHDFAPQDEIVRFRALPSHTFPQSEIASFRAPAPQSADRGGGPAEMSVAFLGLTGPLGALPSHYTQSVIDRIREKDHTLRNFLDLFNHRTISLFYRAWEKHRVPPLLERASAEGREDSFTRALYCLVGLGARSLRNRLQEPDETFLFYAGLMAHWPKNAISLERMLAELFGVPLVLEQFRGQWLLLAELEQTALPDDRRPNGLNGRLGATTIAGQRVWTVESKFRLRVGPVGYDTFQAFLPSRRLLEQLSQVARTYVGPELDFDVQLVLRKDEVPPCELKPGAGGPRLGWNTWACSRPRSNDAEEAVFVSDGRPNPSS